MQKGFIRMISTPKNGEKGNRKRKPRKRKRCSANHPTKYKVDAAWRGRVEGLLRPLQGRLSPYGPCLTTEHSLDLWVLILQRGETGEPGEKLSKDRRNRLHNNSTHMSSKFWESTRRYTQVVTHPAIATVRPGLTSDSAVKLNALTAYATRAPRHEAQTGTTSERDWYKRKQTKAKRDRAHKMRTQTRIQMGAQLKTWSDIDTNHTQKCRLTADSTDDVAFPGNELGTAPAEYPGTPTAPPIWAWKSRGNWPSAWFRNT